MPEGTAPLAPSLPPGPIGGPAAWRGPEMAARSGEWLHHLSPEELDEIAAAVRAHREAGRAMGAISPETFPLPRLAPVLERVKRDLLEGRGFAVLRGLPVERYTTEESAIAYLGIGSHLGSFRSQNAKGHLLGHVRDLGLDIRKPTVRYYQTNRALEYHTDSCDVVGLLCLQARRSPAARAASSPPSPCTTRCCGARPSAGARCSTPSRPTGAARCRRACCPGSRCRCSTGTRGGSARSTRGQYIRSAQSNFPEARRLTEAEREALALLDDMANDPALHLKLEFRPGDMQFLHNHQILHSRTDFEDWPEPERRRHLLRLWLAPREGRPLPPAFAQRYGALTPGDRGGIIVRDTVLTFSLEPQ